MHKSSRIEVIDILRGIAIIGTLGTNIWIFADPAGPGHFLQSLSSAGPFEVALRTVTNGKLLALLTLLFGIGLELQYRSAVRRGMRWPGRYLWRATLLFVEGLLHYVLVFEFDVLMGYALTSMLVAYLVGRSERTIRRWMIAQGAVLGGLVALVTIGLVLTPDTAQPTPAYSSASWVDQVAGRLANWGAYRIEIVIIVPLGTVLFLAGVKLMRAGVFEARGGALRRRLMAYGLGIGLPLNVLTAIAGPDWFMVDRYVAPPLIALGLLGLITEILLGLRGASGPLRTGLTSVGRTALSCYVFQNVAASFLCYDWGLGLANRLAWARPWSVIGLWAVIVAAFMVLSTLWLRRWRRGPLETAWQWAYELPPSRPREALSSTS